MTLQEKIDRFLGSLSFTNMDLNPLVFLDDKELHNLDDNTLEKILFQINETRSRLFDLWGNIVAVQNSRYVNKGVVK